MVVSSGAVFVYVVLAFALALSMRSYLRLRHRERPKDVSKRRIRLINISTAVLGFSWAMFSLLALRQAEPVMAMTFVLGTSTFAFGALAVLTTSTAGPLLCALPVFLANGFGIAFFGHLPVMPSLLLSGGIIALMALFVWGNRQKTKQNVLINVDSTLAEAERAETMERLSQRLSKYLSPQLYTSILQGRQTDEIVSKRKKLTVFFSDIAGFAEITNRLESEELSALLKRYLTEMSRIAEYHGGTVDKFIGDAVVVYFGDPESKGVKEDASACVRMAIEMQNRVRELRREWLDLGLDETFDLRIGINTGFCTVGNFGSDDRIDYTIIGGQVNMAARLEAAADVGGILLANETYALVKEWVIADEREPLTVKGFARPIRTFQLRGITDNPMSKTQVFTRQEPYLSLTMDHIQMSEEERESSAALLREALEKIEGKTSA